MRRFTRPATLASIGLSALLLVSCSEAQAEGLRLQGTFIQLQPRMRQIPAEQWRLDLDALHAAKLDTLVLQWVDGYMTGGPGGAGAVGLVADYACQHEMQVFFGLAHRDDWWRDLADPTRTEALLAEAQRIAEAVGRAYGQRPCFAGWYLPMELSDAPRDAETVAHLRAVWRQMSDACKAIVARPVAIAPYFAGLIPPSSFERQFTEFLDGAGVDIVMLQDGVGARGWDATLEQRVPPFFQAMQRACAANRVELWCDLECFARPSDPSRDGRRHGFVPTQAARIKRQLAAARPFVTRFVTFDAYHYMNPNRGEAQRELYDEYMRDLVNQEFVP